MGRAKLNLIPFTWGRKREKKRRGQGGVSLHSHEHRSNRGKKKGKRGGRKMGGRVKEERKKKGKKDVTLFSSIR